MRLFLLDWFGWSFLWILPLLGRVLLSLLSGKGLRGRGSIRIWLGTLAVLCASSAIEAMLRSQGDAVLETDLFGQALARNVTLAFGKLIAVIAAPHPSQHRPNHSQHAGSASAPSCASATKTACRTRCSCFWQPDAQARSVAAAQRTAARCQSCRQLAGHCPAKS
jgi:hypothetical protein